MEKTWTRLITCNLHCGAVFLYVKTATRRLPYSFREGVGEGWPPLDTPNWWDTWELGVPSEGVG